MQKTVVPKKEKVRGQISSLSEEECTEIYAGL
jgi:hypothetical protein